jgi:MFS family permease
MNLWRDRNLHIVFGVTLMSVLGVASVAPVLPRLAVVFGVSPQRAGLLITSFTFPGVLLTPVAGVLADRFGRRRIMVPALWLFALAGIACAAADSFVQLLVLRALQGVGAAALGALNMVLLGDLYEGRRRAAAMGLNMSVLSVGTALYPALGGLLAELGWRWPFLLAAAAAPVATPDGPSPWRLRRDLERQEAEVERLEAELDAAVAAIEAASAGVAVGKADATELVDLGRRHDAVEAELLAAMAAWEATIAALEQREGPDARAARGVTAGSDG